MFVWRNEKQYFLGREGGSSWAGREVLSSCRGAMRGAKWEGRVRDMVGMVDDESEYLMPKEDQGAGLLWAVAYGEEWAAGRWAFLSLMEKSRLEFVVRRLR